MTAGGKKGSRGKGGTAPLIGALVAVALLGASASPACDLKIESPWIRAAPPTATTLAAYATLKNAGTQALRIAQISAAAADMAMLHETSIVGGMARMRALESVRIPAGAAVELTPGGRHLMLMGLKRVPKAGEHVTITFKDAAGCETSAEFVVRPGASQ